MSDSQLVSAVVDRDIVVATGPDATTYLHGQLSQDIEAMVSGDSAWSLLLDPKGKLVAHIRVTKVDDERYLLDVESGFGPDVVARLERFKLRTAVELELHRSQMVVYRGPGAAEVTTVGTDVAHKHRWGDLDAQDVLGPGVEPVAGQPITVEQLEALRISQGVPAMGAELVAGTIAAEAFIVDDAVSFTKGCYTGQELVARIDSRGSNTPRRLRLVTSVDLVPPVGAELSSAGKTVGSITSVAADGSGGSVALAYVGRAIEPPAWVDIESVGLSGQVLVSAIPAG